MKIWTIIGLLILAGLVSMFIIPPSTRCKFVFWDKNACANIQTAADVLNIDANQPIITQVGDFVQGIKGDRPQTPHIG